MNRSTKELILTDTENPPLVYDVTITEYKSGRHYQRGSFKIDAQTGKVWDEKYLPKLGVRPTKRDFQHIAKTLREGVHGGGTYPEEPRPRPGDASYHWQAELSGDVGFWLPQLHVSAQGWEIEGPLLTRPPWYDYVWRFYDLTPQQRKFMSKHGEYIHYAMNEGDEFEGDIVEYADEDEEGEDERVVGKFWVTGKTDMAPTGRGGRGWAGEVFRKPK